MLYLLDAQGSLDKTTMDAILAGCSRISRQDNNGCYTCWMLMDLWTRQQWMLYLLDAHGSLDKTTMDAIHARCLWISRQDSVGCGIFAAPSADDERTTALYES